MSRIGHNERFLGRTMDNLPVWVLWLLVFLFFLLLALLGATGGEPV